MTWTADQFRDRMVALLAEYELSKVPNVPLPIPVTGDLLTAIADAPEDATLDLQGQTFGLSASLVLDKPLTLQNGTVEAVAAGINDLFDIRGEDVKLLNLTVRGNGSTKRGIAANGRTMLFDGLRVENIRRAGQESQAIAIWNGTGLTVRNFYLEGGSIGFLSGGAGTDVPNHVPSTFLIENGVISRPLEWRGQGYGCKTGFEVKNGQHGIVRNVVIENVWREAQNGYAVTLTPSDPVGNSPETIVENWLFENVTLRDVGGGVNLLGSTQHEQRPTRRTSRVVFNGGSWELSRAQFGGHGAVAMIGRGPDVVAFHGLNVTTDGDAFLRTSDAVPVTSFQFTGNTIRTAGMYGIFTPLGSRGGPWLQTIFPGMDFSGNTIVNAPSQLRAALASNTYLTEVS